MNDPEILDDGMQCPKCQGFDLRAYYTRREKNRVRRVRICRCCGTRVQTFEEISRVLPSPVKREKSDTSNTGTEQHELPFD